MTACDAIREALSARLDDELRPLEEAAVDSHLGGCPSCTSHAAELSGLHRTSRVAAADAVPDLTQTILAAHRSARPATVGVPSTDWRRWALGVIGLSVAILAVPSLLAGDAGTPIHLSRELAAWEVALAASLVVVAWQPRRADGVFPLAAVVVVILGATAFTDALAGDIGLAGESHHVLQLVAVALLFSLARSERSASNLQVQTA